MKALTEWPKVKLVLACEGTERKFQSWHALAVSGSGPTV
jgi:hypothetical protein